MDTRRRDYEWTVTDRNGNIVAWDQCQLAVLMDIRDELKALNRVIGCHNTMRIPGLLDDIRRNTTKPKKKQTKKRKVKR